MHVVEQGGEIEEAITRVDTKDSNNRVKAMKNEVNKEIVAWVTTDGAKINYPITQAKNNYYYLDRSYEKKYSIAGSIFADYRNKVGEDAYSVIYGHNMSGKRMFGYLNELDKEEFFNTHKTGKVYFEDSAYDLEVLAYGAVENSTRVIYEVEKYRNDANSVVNTLESLVKYKRQLNK